MLTLEHSITRSTYLSIFIMLLNSLRNINPPLSSSVSLSTLKHSDCWFHWLREEENKMPCFSHHFWENLIRTQSLPKVQMSNHQRYQSLHLIKWIKAANYCPQTEGDSGILIVCFLAKANWCITKCILRDLLKLFWLKKGVLYETEVNTQSLAPEMFVNFLLLESHTW